MFSSKSFRAAVLLIVNGPGDRVPETAVRRVQGQAGSVSDEIGDGSRGRQCAGAAVVEGNVKRARDSLNAARARGYLVDEIRSHGHGPAEREQDQDGDKTGEAWLWKTHALASWG
jgi:hypothetical protein